MSIFSEHALPEIPLEDLMILQIAMTLYVKGLQQRRPHGPVEVVIIPEATRILEEIETECIRRWGILEKEKEDKG